jgi:hypothetical protein
LTKRDVVSQWTQKCQEALDQLKQSCVSAPLLARLDFSGAFILNVDWSTKGVGVILSQKDGNNTTTKCGYGSLVHIH